MYLIDNAVYCFKNLLKVNGRSRRKEYWCYRLVVLLCIILFSFIVAVMIGLENIEANADVIKAIFSVVNGGLIFSATVRRLHDIGRSGWWFILFFIPIIGDIILLIFTVQKGNEGDNQFGPDPRRGNTLIASNEYEEVHGDLSA
ncbi:DUF805 domain-containing protein [Escherichia coli]|uniref:DUF805 domain-containing protein n=1 Tax=Escherichia coli TaxID=562 RepID=UPI0011C86041|nr:DUF805 domain-containing protein [Escherichia coli]MBS9139671.1 DUF805 domain-containing protein [Escherichia coli]TXO63052.1 DUF805 domain-containing protein [Escherichia coli]